MAGLHKDLHKAAANHLVKEVYHDSLPEVTFKDCGYYLYNARLL